MIDIDRDHIGLVKRGDTVLLRTNIGSSNVIGFNLSDLEYSKSWVSTFSEQVDVDDLTDKQLTAIREVSKRVPKGYKNDVLSIISNTISETVNIYGDVIETDSSMFNARTIKKLDWSEVNVVIHFKDKTSITVYTPKENIQKIKDLYIKINRTPTTLDFKG